jgi:hypothetical protein
MTGNNETVFMTRRYPKLCHKILRRDAKISAKLISAWDIEKNSEKVLSIYLKEKDNLSDERYWELLRTVWILSGKLSNVNIFRSLMLSERKEKYYFSTPEDAKRLKEMPEQFEVYRAGSDNDYGISWTISKEYAEWYLNTYQKDRVLTRTVNRKDVFAFIQRNLEFEIIIL